MNPILSAVYLFVGIIVLAHAGTGLRTAINVHGIKNSIRNNMKPSNWLSSHELESLPAINEITLEMLEHMPVEEGADLLNKLHHLIQVKGDIEPSYVPQPSDMLAHLITHDNRKMSIMLNELPKMAMSQKNFGENEVTIIITGLPQDNETIKKATRKLMEAYIKRYNGKDHERSNQKPEDLSGEKSLPTSSEEEQEANNEPSGSLVVIDMGAAIPTFMHHATLDIEETGAKIADILMQLIDKTDISRETIHLIGSNMGAHVAGATGRHYTRKTGLQMSRITGLDPSKMFAKKKHSLTGLARGDAKFVDAIHTSALGLGTSKRSGDADFYPNGPDAGTPGADNVLDASMRAMLYYAETVIPGNERNFPALAATSLKEYKNKTGKNKHIHMGIDIDHDVKGDFILLVNANSPFGRKVSTRKQRNL